MGRYKEIPGISYEILHYDEYKATIEYTYFCPRCKREITEQTTIFDSDDYINIYASFVAPFECECGDNTYTHIKIWGDSRIDRRRENNRRICENFNCQRPLDNKCEFIHKWEHNNRNAYVICRHCGYKNYYED